MGTIKRNFYNNITPTGKFDATDLTGTVPADNIANASMTNVTSVPASVGDFVQKVSSDPSPAGAGDVWYNTTSNALKSVVSLEAWSSASPVITANGFMGYASEGTQTAGLLFGGYNTGGPPYQRNITESYNGSGWTSEANINTARNDGHGFGSQTSAGFVNGTTNPSTRTSATEEYDGSTWTTVNSNPHSEAYDGVAGGPQTAAWRAGGYTTSPNNSTQLYDGTSWTASNTLGTARYSFGGNGSQTSGIAFAGIVGGTRQTVTEEFDGTSWTAGGSYPTGVSGVKGFGYSQTTAVGVGGGTSPPSIVTTTCTYDGSSWTNSPATLADSASAGGVGGSSSAGFYASGIRTAPGTYKASTEEYNVSTNVITGAAWSSGGNLPVALRGFIATGDATAGLGFGGTNPSPASVNSTLEYDGSSWTSGGNLPTAATEAGAAGTQTAGLGVLQASSPNTTVPSVEYDGSTWSSPANIGTGRYTGRSAGSQTAAFFAGGTLNSDPGAYTSTNATEEYDGSTWTTGGNLPSARNRIGASGTLTAGLVFAGSETLPLVGIKTTNEYDGTAWSSSNDMINDWYNTRGAGTQTSTIAGQGSPTPGTFGVSYENYNGTTWVTSTNASTSTIQRGTFGDTSNAVAAGGGGAPPTGTNATEEFTGEITATNVKTISTS